MILPVSTTEPAYITVTSSHISAITPRSCVISSIAVPFSSLRSLISLSIWAWMVTSSAVVGSSAIKSFGSHAIIMAIITLWRIPPESSCGYIFTTASGFGILTSSSMPMTCLVWAGSSFR